MTEQGKSIYACRCCGSREYSTTYVRWGLKPWACKDAGHRPIKIDMDEQDRPEWCPRWSK